MRYKGEGGQAAMNREVLDALQEEEDNIRKRFGRYIAKQIVEETVEPFEE